MYTSTFCMLFVFFYALISTETSIAQETTTVSLGNGDCTFKTHTQSKEEINAYNRIAPLVGKYAGRYPSTGLDPSGYSYEVGICKPVAQEDLLPGNDANKYAGVVQTSSDSKPFILGRIDAAAIMGGTDWVMLEYKEGGAYHNSCGKEGKRSVIMIICDPRESQGQLRFIEENKNKTGECYYLFELTHHTACSIQHPPGLSIGSILVIVLLCLVAVYLIGGFAYQRVVVGAKGIEQLPNSAFWRDFGNLTADGCDFVCRSGNRTPEDRQYRGIGDDQLTTSQDDDDDTRDDHLLPM